MNIIPKLLISALLGVGTLAPLTSAAQHRGSSRSVQTTRPGGSTVTRQPQSARPTNNNARPQTRPSSRPGNRPNQPGRPNRPNLPNNPKPPRHDYRPDNRHHRPGSHRPGTSSVVKPGAWAGTARPHYNYRRHDYRPPRPGGGFWGAPAPNPYRIRYWAPPVPRYVTVLPSVPGIGTILGLTFGSFIDAGISSLFNAGYNIAGYYDNAIYLSNVRQLGYLWPEVMVQYTDGLMSGTQFYNWTAMPDQAMYYNIYNQLCARYGNPVDINYNNSGPTSTWWAGGNTGYITLSYGYGPSATGINNYYTSLTYSAY